MTEFILSNVNNSTTVTQSIIVDATEHQVSIEPSGGATGNVLVSVKAYGRTTYEDLTVAGVAVSIDLTNSQTVRFCGRIDSIKFTPVNLVGTFQYKVISEVPDGSVFCG